MRWRSRRDREQDLERELRSDLELEANLSFAVDGFGGR